MPCNRVSVGTDDSTRPGLFLVCWRWPAIREADGAAVGPVGDDLQVSVGKEAGGAVQGAEVVLPDELQDALVGQAGSVGELFGGVEGGGISHWLGGLWIGRWWRQVGGWLSPCIR